MHLRLPVKVEEIDSDDRSDISPETVVEIYKKQMIKIYIMSLVGSTWNFVCGDNEEQEASWFLLFL